MYSSETCIDTVFIILIMVSYAYAHIYIHVLQIQNIYSQRNMQSKKPNNKQSDSWASDLISVIYLCVFWTK